MFARQLYRGALPFLKWAGGKGQLLPQYAPYFRMAVSGGTYHEPFLGSGAVFFYVQGQRLFRRYVLSDANSELINLFLVVRDQPQRLLELLHDHQEKHSKSHYYQIRRLDRECNWQDTPAIERASRMLYLNKTCYNGLWRVNSKGYFNVPMGRYKRPDIYNPDRIISASYALQDAAIEQRAFETVAEQAERGDFVYLDPPYVPLSETSNFTTYSADSFTVYDQERLASVFAELDRLGCHVMLSNSDTPLVHELYSGFSIEKVEARRAINSKAARRGAIREVVVVNFKGR